MRIKLEFRTDVSLIEALELVSEINSFVDIEGLEFRYYHNTNPAITIITTGEAEEAQFKQKVVDLTDKYNVVDFRVMGNNVGGEQA